MLTKTEFEQITPGPDLGRGKLDRCPGGLHKQGATTSRGPPQVGGHQIRFEFVLRDNKHRGFRTKEQSFYFYFYRATFGLLNSKLTT